MASPGSDTDADATRYPRLERLVRDEIARELVSRKYERIEDGPPDFRVAVELIFRGGRGPGSTDSPYGSDAVPASAKGSGQTGTLIVRMLDPGTSEVLWEGRVSGFRVDVIKPEAELRRAAWRLLVEFPPITGS
jgi:hypothetical protein